MSQEPLSLLTDHSCCTLSLKLAPCNYFVNLITVNLAVTVLFICLSHHLATSILHSHHPQLRHSFIPDLKPIFFTHPFHRRLSASSGLTTRIIHRYRFFTSVFSEREREFTLYAIARPSVRLSSVCNFRAPYSGGSNFRQYFYGIRYLGHPLTSTENFTEIVPGESLRRGT